jgi:hypothetical protein
VPGSETARGRLVNVVKSPNIAPGFTNIDSAVVSKKIVDIDTQAPATETPSLIRPDDRGADAGGKCGDGQWGEDCNGLPIREKPSKDG